MSKNIYFTSLAINQTIFWLSICKSRSNAHKFRILCFDSESVKKIKDHKYIIDMTSTNNNFSNYEQLKLFKKFNIKDVKKLLNHEIENHGKKNYKKIVYKFVNDLYNIDKELFNKKGVIIQELGGFSPNIATYLYSQKKKLDHYFLEPSFFNGRFHGCKNSLQDFRLKNKFFRVDEKKIIKILNQKIKTKDILIPKKDIEHFKNPFTKYFKLRNLSRFVYKHFTSVMFRYRFVFFQNLSIVLKYFKEFLNFILMLPLYKKLNNKKNYIYFPLHVPNDIALTLRAPNFQNQISLINKLCNFFANENVVIKEHPARAGSINLRRILKKHKNLSLLHPFINNYDVIKKSKFVVTINSKSGFEALILDKKIVPLSDSYYNSEKTTKLSLNKLKKKNLSNIFVYKETNFDKIKFFKKLYQNSLQGELYLVSKINIKNFKESLLNLTKSL